MGNGVPQDWKLQGSEGKVPHMFQGGVWSVWCDTLLLSDCKCVVNMQWHSVMWCVCMVCGVAWRGVAWRGVAWRGVAWRGVAWRAVVWRGVAWRGVTWRAVVLCGVIQWCCLL